jgi:hypothetical protein
MTRTEIVKCLTDNKAEFFIVKEESGILTFRVLVDEKETK